MSNIRLSETMQRHVREVVDHFINEDINVRYRQIRTWKKLKLMWEGFQRTWYSEVAHDWRIWDEETQGDDTQQAYYDRPINVFRAYLESIIAALSVTVPPITCYPDDAENTLDLQTAKAGDKIAALLFRHNDIPLLWLHSLFVFCTEGMVACYSYPKSDDDYGTYEKKDYQEVDEQHQYARCPNCGYNMSDEMVGTPEAQAIQDKLQQNEDKFMPEDEDIPIQDYINENGTEEFCPACAQQIIPMLVTETLTVTRLVGVTNEPKTRVCMEAYGGLNIKIPVYARRQCECPYLFYSYETHYANAIEEFKDLDSEKLREQIGKNKGGPRDPYMEEWARLSPQYNGIYPTNIVTVRHCWLRPAAFNVLDEETGDHFKKKFPNGCKVSYVNDLFAGICNEELDDCWTITYNPLADYVHYDPLGLLLVSVQELTNDIISLTTQTMEHGIGQTFVDPETLNFDAYRQLEATPGGVYEAKPKSGKALGESFYEAKTATLSGEVLPFFQQIQNLGQLVSGALPSLFGGQMQQGSGTASEYSMSRAQALQRLQNTWKMLTLWWKTVFGKAIPTFIKEMKEDERNVERSKDGNFINVFIRKAELEGKLGKIELEANENLPITWNQRKDVVMQLLQAGIPEVLQILGAPENLPVIREAIGLDDFFVPGEDAREKCYEDIKLLLNSEPIMDPMMGQELPSVEIDQDFDDLDIIVEIVRNFVTSEAGRQAKVDNQAGYKNVLLYGRQAKMMGQMQAMQQAMAGGPPAEKPKQDTSTPIKGEENVPTAE